MKLLLSFLLCVFTSPILWAQGGPASLDKIPLPSGFKLIDGEQPFFDELYREELSRGFLNADKTGKYKNYALKVMQFRQYQPGEGTGNQEQNAFDFYMKQLNATVIDTDRKEQPDPEPDLNLLSPGEGTSVLYYPGSFGGGVFKWYWHDGDIKELTVTISSPMLLVERTFVKDLPVVIPAEPEMGYPLYPGAEFQPLKSAWRKGPEGFGTRKMVFQTTDAPEQVKAYFEKQLSQKAKTSESRTPYSFVKQDPTPGSYRFSSLTINNEILTETNATYTVIEYYYPYP